jgi:hypothetical protein
LKEGKAINTKIKAGVIVQINSINVPWLRYLLLIGALELSKFLIIAPCIQPTLNNMATK